MARGGRQRTRYTWAARARIGRRSATSEATNLVPPDVKDVRVVDIVGLDQQADGGTHVASPSQVGRIEVVKIENKGKGFRRLRIRVSD